MQVDEVLSRLEVGNKDFLDFEALSHPYISVLIEVSDNGNPPLAFNQTFNFTITNVNEPPSNVTLLPSLSFPEDLASGAIIGQLEALNPDENQTLTFTMMDIPHPVDGPTFGVFVNSTGSYLQLINNANLTQAVGDYDIQLNVSDDGSPVAWTIAILSLAVTRIDPCSLGTLNCGSNATCNRINITSGVCTCDFGYILNSQMTACEKLDNCHVEADASASLSITENIGQIVLPNGAVLLPLCVNNGTCTDLGNSSTCSCGERWTGPTCETYVNPCNKSVPVCKNGGQCLDGENGAACICSKGYDGDNCELNINECYNEPCGYGTCVDGIGNFTCICPEYLSGGVCQYKKDSCVGNACNTGKACVPRRITSTGEIPNEAPLVNPDGAKASPFAPIDYYCIPEYDWTPIKFGNRSLTDDEKDLWKEFVLSTQYIGADGKAYYPDDVYFEPDLPDGKSSYVVLYKDEVVKPPVVTTTQQKQCKDLDMLPSDLQALCQEWNASPGQAYATGPPIDPPQPITSGYTTNAILGAVCLITVLVIAVVTARFFYARRKMQKSRETQDGSVAGVMSDEAAAEHAYEYDYDTTLTATSATSAERQDSIFVRNPLYHNPRNDLYGPDEVRVAILTDLEV